MASTVGWNDKSLVLFFKPVETCSNHTIIECHIGTNIKIVQKFPIFTSGLTRLLGADPTVMALPKRVIIIIANNRSIGEWRNSLISVLSPASAHFQEVEPSRFIFHERLVSQRPARRDGREIGILIIPAEVRGTVPTKG